MAKKASRWVLIVLLPLLIVILLPFIPLIVLFGLGHAIYGLYLKRSFRIKWSKRGKFVLLTYSESPNWQSYIEGHILPKIEAETVILNWSKRSPWKHDAPLEAKVFRHWGGGREFNPLAVVIPKKGKVEVIRFFKAFKDYKYGKDTLLKQQESRLFELIENLKSS